MIADHDDDPNGNLEDMRASCNGTHVATDRDTFDTNTPESPWYRAMKAGLEAWEIWQDMSNAERLDMILTQMPQQQWYLHDPYTTDNLSTLAAFRSDAKMWGYIKAVFKSKGGNPWDLERAVEQALQEQAADAAPHARSSTERPRFHIMSAAELYAKSIPPQAWIIQDLLPAGATLFAGRGKDGKSLLAWNLCFAVATGGMALGRYHAEQGNVLYLALEDGERRAQKRLKEQMNHANMRIPPAYLDLVLWEAPRIGEGFEEACLTWLDERAAPRLVVVDILEKIRPRRTRNTGVYADDYAAIAPLQRLAQEHDIGLLIVHHSNKSKPDDFRDTANGSMGLIGACDSFWGLQRIAGEADAVLKIIGQDVDTQELAMRFANGFWSVLGDAATVTMNATYQAILETLTTEARPLTPTTLATMLDLNINTMKSSLKRLVDKGLVVKWGTGHYIPRLPKETE
jgi:hypothetical protein